MPAFQLQSIYSNAAPQIKQRDIPRRLFLYCLCSLNPTCLREWMGDKYNRVFYKTGLQQRRRGFIAQDLITELESAVSPAPASRSVFHDMTYYSPRGLVTPSPHHIVGKKIRKSGDKTERFLPHTPGRNPSLISSWSKSSLQLVCMGQ